MPADVTKTRNGELKWEIENRKLKLIVSKINSLQERIKGNRGHPPYTPYSTGNSSRVIFRPVPRP